MNKKDAIAEGKRRGYSAATWVFDGNTTERTYREVLRLYDNGDPALEAIVSTPEWLSGEWAGESISELLPDLPDNADKAEEYQNAYVEAADTTFWREVLATARRQTKPEKRVRYRWYIGYQAGGQREVFRASKKPSRAEFTYLSVWGPFRTRRAADYAFAHPGVMRTIAQWEETAKAYARGAH